MSRTKRGRRWKDIKLTAPQQELAASCVFLARGEAAKVWSSQLRRHCDPEEAQDEASVFLCYAADAYDPERINPRTGRPYAFSTLVVSTLRKVMSAQIIRRHQMGKRRPPGVISRLTPCGRLDNGPNLDSCEGPTARPEGPPALEDDERGVLMSALSALPAALADVLRMRFLEGLLQREVAARLGCSRDFVRSQEQRALAAIREGLKGTGLEEVYGS